ncbi:hypothetical protein ACFSE1_02930 [Rhizobium helianthi]|uniref:Uncharacterized protein n=1 Tax=Rhizobium helianthi TaxID=1132695 RepID=A0ABW4M1L3_9HYPH
MTQVLSVSANTAAFAMEAMKPSRRVSTRDQVQDAKQDTERNEERVRGGSPEETTALIPATPMSLDLALHHGQQPLTDHRAVENAYRENSENE